MLVRQMRRAGVSVDPAPSDPALLALLDAVSAEYDDADTYVYLTDRAFEISGREMQEAVERLQAGATAAQRGRTRLLAVLDAIPSPLVVLSGEARITECNASARALLAPASDPVGRGLDEVLPAPREDAGAAAALADLRDAVRDARAWAGMLTSRTPARVTRLRASATPLAGDEEGSTLLLVTEVVHDPGA